MREEEVQAVKWATKDEVLRMIDEGTHTKKDWTIK